MTQKTKLSKIITEALTFDDVLLKPAASKVLPAEADISTHLTSSIKLGIPIISSPMDTVTESTMAIAMGREGGIGIIHRNLTVEEQVDEVKLVKREKVQVGAAVGTGDGGFDRAAALIKANVDVIVVDTAHGHSEGVIQQVARLRKAFKKVQLIAGNIATKEAALDLIKAGADAVKVGIGPGSICTTRIVAGVGVPQLTAIMDCYEACAAKKIPLIADGGFKSSGDIAKAIAAGASAVMLGSLLAGTDETPGDVFMHNGRNYKSFRGMGSVGAMSRGSAERYFQDKKTKPEKFVPEGVEGQVPYKGSVANVLYQLTGGLRSGMGYTGHGSIKSMRGNCQFVRITNAGLRESHVHDVMVTKEAPNY